MKDFLVKPSKEIPDRQREELLLFHQQFLQSPISTRIRELLDKHESNIIDFIATRATATESVTDQQLRHYAVQLNETRKIIKTIYDPETFLSKSAC